MSRASRTFSFATTRVTVRPPGKPPVFFSSVYLKTLRDYRIAILGWGIGMGLVIVSPMASVSTLINTPQARAALAALAAQFAWNADPVAAGTVGGYATFKIGIFIFLMAVWPLLAASRMLRGEEEAGSLDVLLSLPRTRLQVAVQKVAAMWTALLVMAVVIGVMAYLGGVAFKGDFNLVDGWLFGLNLALMFAVIGGLALLISQFTHERGPAAGATGGLLLVFIVVDMVHRVIPNTDWFSHLSPIYYYNLSKPLIPSYGTSRGGDRAVRTARYRRCRRSPGLRSVRPVRAPQRGAAGAGLVARLRICTQPCHSGDADLVVDARHSGVRSVDGRGRAADGRQAEHPADELAERVGGTRRAQEDRRRGDRTQRDLPRRHVRAAASPPDGLRSHAGQSVERRCGRWPA